MTVFVDASALVSIVVREIDAEHLMTALDGEHIRLISGIALWEAAVAVARIKNIEVAAGLREVERYVVSLELNAVSIGASEAAGAVHAQACYGKGTRHLARLNMGDCFAYACAKTNGAKLLYKGEDFIHTDLA